MISQLPQAGVAQAAAAVRPRRLLRCVVLVAVLPLLVRRDAAGPPMRSAFAGTASSGGALRRCSSPASTILVADIEHVAGQLAAPPMLIGAFDGGLRHRADAGDPSGPRRSAAGARAARRIVAQWPRGSLPRIRITFPTSPISIRRSSPTACSATLRAVLFQRRRGRRPSCREAQRHMQGRVATRAARPVVTPAHGAARNGRPRRSWYSGAHDDRICTPADARATAHHHGVEATILPGMAHMLMLEPEWETAAEALAEWLAQNK